MSGTEGLLDLGQDIGKRVIGRRSAHGYGDGKIELASDLAVPLLGAHLEKTPILKDTCISCSLQHCLQ